MARSLRDSVVVVTGASSGIGRATALAFAREGASVVVAARREEPLHEVAGECDRLGVRCVAQPTDVADEEAVRALARRALQECGRIDVWVNNAGVGAYGRLEDTPPDAWRRVIETNLFGAVHGARAVLPVFREQGRGTLVNVASVVGKIGAPWATAYVTSKFGIVGLSESLREELMDAPGIHVCTILPATTDTPFFQHAANFSGRALQAMPPVHDAEDVARAIVRCARHPQREVFVGNARGLNAIRRVAPGLAERLFARVVDREHFRDAAAPSSSGSLFQPMAHGTGVSGGWRTPPTRGRRVARGLLTVAGVAALGAGAWWIWREAARDGGLRRDGALGRILGGGALVAGLQRLRDRAPGRADGGGATIAGATRRLAARARTAARDPETWADGLRTLGTQAATEAGRRVIGMAGAAATPPPRGLPGFQRGRDRLVTRARHALA